MDSDVMESDVLHRNGGCATLVLNCIVLTMMGGEVVSQKATAIIIVSG
jgi:hypothetical protein